MLILLPPSEGKTAPASGPALDLSALSIPEFTALRTELVAELEEVSRRPDALNILGVGPSIADEVATQITLREQPCAPAWQVYTGVLYQALDMGSFSAAQLTRAGEHTLIFSGLFGATSPLDPIPSYRLGMNVELGGAKISARWAPLWPVLNSRASGLVIDARSGAYAGWKVPASCDVVKITATRITGATSRTISHAAKYFRGRVARLALLADTPPREAEELAELCQQLVGDETAAGAITGVELGPARRGVRELAVVETVDAGRAH